MADEKLAKIRLSHGARFPYDAPDSWWRHPGEPIPPPANDWAHAAARGVVADLNDRHTIKRGFAGIDEETRAEIVASLAAIIRAANAGPADATPAQAGFIVANSNRDKFRCWVAEGPAWTTEKSKAVLFVRRKDAEQVFAEDEDAWAILPVTAADLEEK